MTFLLPTPLNLYKYTLSFVEVETKHFLRLDLWGEDKTKKKTKKLKKRFVSFKFNFLLYASVAPDLCIVQYFNTFCD